MFPTLKPVQQAISISILPCASVKRSICSRSGPEPFQRVSRIFQPMHTLKKILDKDDEIVSRSFELLVGAGYIRQSSSGVFHILPLCQRVLDKMTAIVDQQMAAISANKIAMPTLVRDTLWKQTGRWEKMGAELLTVEDRIGHRFVLSPTHEEAVTQLVGSVAPISSRLLPLRLYQITTKFRDEKRPRFGLLRCKEFLMKDLYTFDGSEEEARQTYHEVGQAYTALFRHMGVPTVKVRGDCGVMGGGVSHEFHVLAPVGEDAVLAWPDCQQPDCPAAVNLEVTRAGDRQVTCQACGHTVHRHTGIEVGHTFLLGQLYSEALGACSTGADGVRSPLHMGCYGLGISRLLAAVVEARAGGADDLCWPPQLAPFRLCVITPKRCSREEAAAGWAWQTVDQLCQQPALRGDVAVDDRDHLTIGQRVREARRTGYPAVLVFGREAVSAAGRPGRAELIHGADRRLLQHTDLAQQVASLFAASGTMLGLQQPSPPH